MMNKVYIYVVDRDFGFAPNPFHGVCTLATCKSGIRKNAEVEDWVIGIGGSRLEAKGRCIFAMRVTAKLTFKEYWDNPEYLDKRPIRNGSRKMMVGDNIYRYDRKRDQWLQADSHHSNADGTMNADNLRMDIKVNNVLISRHFFYFGSSAPAIPSDMLHALGYRNQRNYRVFDRADCSVLITWLKKFSGGALNEVSADPFDFDDSHRRYSVQDNKIL